jgi:hypothetical protein
MNGTLARGICIVFYIKTALRIFSRSLSKKTKSVGHKSTVALSRFAVSEMKSLIFLFFHGILIILSINGQRLRHIGGLSENESCPYTEEPQEEFGICKKISECQDEYQKYKTSKGELKVCSYQKSNSHTTICCRHNTTQGSSKRGVTNERQTSISLNFEACLNRYIEHRKSEKNVDDLIAAIDENSRTITDEDCANIEINNAGSTCHDKKIERSANIDHGTLAKDGDWPNMAAIGWTNLDGNIDFNCGGTIVNERFIITAAHCRFVNRKEPDTVRVGDFFLATTEHDENAQQLSIENFIFHPSYKSSESYNDIALIKTREKIKFSRFVAPACIPFDVNPDINEFLFIAGYGQVSLMVFMDNSVLKVNFLRMTTHQRTSRMCLRKSKCRWFRIKSAMSSLLTFQNSIMA